MKEFKTYRQQLRILRERGLIIKNGSKAIELLKEEGYYNIVNGYKEIFLDSSRDEEFFLPNTTFEELYNLCVFDRELRNLYIKYILIFESSLKSSLAHIFSQNHKELNAYLSINNFTDDKSKVTQVLKQINKRLFQVTLIKKGITQ